MNPSEHAVSIDAAIAMRASFASSGSSLAALKFFDALVDLLTGSGQKQQAACRFSGNDRDRRRIQLAAGRKQTSNMPCGTHPVQAFAATDTGRAASRSDGLQCRVQQCQVQYAAQQLVIMTTRNLDAR